MAYNDKMVRAIYKSPIILGKILGYDKLIDIHDEWILWCWLSNTDVYLQAHRDSYKTTAVIVLGTIWRFLFNPDLTISLIRKAETGAQATLGEISKQYESEAMQYVYSEYFDCKFKLTDYNKSQLNLPTRKKISKEANIDCYGKGGSITGYHYDLELIDDIITMKDRYSKAERESTKNYVYETKNTLRATGRRIFTNTPWHPDDASICMPVPKKYPLGSINIPEMNTPEKLADLKKLPRSLYALNYELRDDVIDEKSLFPDMLFMPWKQGVSSVGWIDPAWGGACTTGVTFIQEIGNNLIVRGWIYPNHISDVKKELSQNARDCNCIDLMFESNGIDNKRMAEVRSIYPIMRGVQAHDNKNYRIVFNIKQNLDRIYFADDCSIAYLEQIKNYQEGEIPNEAPDSLASLLREKYTHARSDIKVSGQKNVKKDIDLDDEKEIENIDFIS